MTVRRFLSNCGIYNDFKSDPQIIRDIVENDMKLRDMAEVKEILSDLLSGPQSLFPIIDSIKSSIEKNHPNIEVFLRCAMDEGLIYDIPDKGREIIFRMINYIAILDRITMKMSIDNSFAEKIFNYLLERRVKVGIRPGLLSSFIDIYVATGRVFEPIKAKSVDLVMSGVISIRKSGNMTADMVKKRKIALVINIIEAGLTEFLSGYRKNATVSLKLTKRPYRNSWLDENNGQILNDSSQEWASLYESWNLAFITGNMDYLHIFYPKLLIPQVIGSPPQSYMHRRVIALWLTVNFFLFAKMEKKPSYELPNRRKLALRWGEINLEPPAM